MSLTPKQERMLALRAQGLTEKETAHKLGIGYQTLKNNMSQIYRQLHVRNIVAAFAVLGWLRVPDDAEQ